MSDTLNAAAAALQRQEAKGLSKYGATLDRADLTARQLIDHAIEEAADQLMYLIRLREALNAEKTGQVSPAGQ